MDEHLLNAARSIRPYLGELVDVTDAVHLDDELARLLAAANRGTDVTAALLDRLFANAVTRAWVRDFVHDPEHRPPNLHGTARGYAPLPGHGEPITADRYVCPGNDFTWYRSAVGEPVPACPTHGPGLVPG